MLDKNNPNQTVNPSASIPFDVAVKFLEERKDKLHPVLLFRQNGTVFINYTCAVESVFPTMHREISEVTENRFNCKQLHKDKDIAVLWEFQFSTTVKTMKQLEILIAYSMNRIFNSWEEILDKDGRFYFDSEYALKSFIEIDGVTIVDMKRHHGVGHRTAIHWIVKQPKITPQKQLRFKQKIQQELGAILMDIISLDKMRALTPDGSKLRFMDLALTYRSESDIMFSLQDYSEPNGFGDVPLRSPNDLLWWINTVLKDNQNHLLGK